MPRSLDASRVMAESDRIVAETVKAVQGLVESVPIYQDALQPAAKELGVALHTVAKCVNLALAPVAALVWGYDKIKAFVDTRVSEKLASVLPEKIITPRPEVAGPALEALRYSGHDNNLRELYANLLATSMDADTAANAHPGFVEIIKNLSPDEARIMRLFATRLQFPLLDVRAHLKELPEQYEDVVVNYSHVGREAGCEHMGLVQAYVDNLCRVRLLEIEDLAQIAALNTYEPLENDPMLDPVKKEIEGSGQTVRFKRKILQRTTWGYQFCRACVIEKKAV
jgi:hypothetical protein